MYTHLLVVYYVAATAVINTIKLLVCVSNILTVSLSMEASSRKRLFPGQWTNTQTNIHPQQQLDSLQLLST